MKSQLKHPKTIDYDIPCMPNSPTTHGEQCWIAGWGATSDKNTNSASLRSITINSMSREYCINKKHR